MTHRFRFFKTSLFKETALINQELTKNSKKGVLLLYLGLLRLQPGNHRLKNHWNCVLPNSKMGEAYKGKKLEVYINCQELEL